MAHIIICEYMWSYPMDNYLEKLSGGMCCYGFLNLGQCKQLGTIFQHFTHPTQQLSTIDNIYKSYWCNSFSASVFFVKPTPGDCFHEFFTLLGDSQWWIPWYMHLSSSPSILLTCKVIHQQNNWEGILHFDARRPQLEEYLNCFWLLTFHLVSIHTTNF